MKYVFNLTVGLPLALMVNDVPTGLIVNAIVTILTTWIVEYYKNRKNRNNAKK